MIARKTMKVKKKLSILIMTLLLLGQTVGTTTIAIADYIEGPSISSENKEDTEFSTTPSKSDELMHGETNEKGQEDNLVFEEVKTAEKITEIEEVKDGNELVDLQDNLGLSFTINFDEAFGGSSYFSETTYMSGEKLNFKTGLNYSQINENNQEIFINPYVRYILKKSGFKNIAIQNWPSIGNSGISDKRVYDNPNNSEEIFVEIELTDFRPGNSMTLPFYVELNNYTYKDDDSFVIKQEFRRDDGTLLKEEKTDGIAKTTPFFNMNPYTYAQYYESQTNEQNEVNNSEKEVRFSTLMQVNNKPLDKALGIDKRVHRWELIIPEGVTLLSSDLGGKIEENKVVWEKTAAEIEEAFKENIFKYSFMAKVSYEGAKHGDIFKMNTTFSYVEEDGSINLQTSFPIEANILVKPDPPVLKHIMHATSGPVYKDVYTTDIASILTEKKYDFDYRIEMSPYSTHSGDARVEVELANISYEKKMTHSQLKSAKFILHSESEALIPSEVPQYSKNILYGINSNGERTQIYEDIIPGDEVLITTDDEEYNSYEIAFKTPVKFLSYDGEMDGRHSITIQLNFDISEQQRDDIYNKLSESPEQTVTYASGIASSKVIDPFNKEANSATQLVQGRSKHLQNTISKLITRLNSNQMYVGDSVSLTESPQISNIVGTFEKIDGNSYEVPNTISYVYLLPEGLEVTDVTLNNRKKIEPDQIIKNYQSTGKNAFFFTLNEWPNGTTITVTANIYANHNVKLVKHQIDTFFYWQDQQYFIGKENSKAIVEANRFGEIPGSRLDESVLATSYELQVANTESLATYKLVKEKESNAPFLSKIRTQPNMTVTYQIALSNTTTSDFDYIESLDVLPYAGDHRLISQKEPRNSEFEVNLLGPVQGPEGYEVLYSIDAQKSTYLEDFSSSWLTESEISTIGFEKVKKIKIKMKSNQVLAGGTKAIFEYDGLIPTENKLGNGKIANNTVGTRSTELGKLVESADAAIKIVQSTSVVKVTSKDENGNEIDGVPTGLYTGKPGEKLTITPPNIPGYELISDISTLPIIYPDEDTEVELNYIKVTKIKVTFTDLQGNELQPEKVSTQRVNTEYITSAPETIQVDEKQYTLLETPANARGTVLYKEIEVNYIYSTDEAIEEGIVIVRYVDQDGKELADSEQLVGRVDEKYLTVGKAISGYMLTELPVNQSGFFKSHPIEVVYIYKKISPIIPDKEKPNELDTNNNQSNKEKPNGIEKDKGANSDKTWDVTKPYSKLDETNIDFKKKKLPKTNSESTIRFTIIGLVIVSSVGFVFINQRKKKS